MQLESDKGGATVPRDRRTLGQTSTFLERGVDLERLREDRLRKVQTEMRARDVGMSDARLGVDCLDYHGFSALQGLGVRLTDADDPVEAARVIKTTDDIELLKQSAAVCEAALYDLAEAIRTGVSEHELPGVFYQKMLSLGGEHCFSHLYFVSMAMSKMYWTRIIGGASVLPTKVDRRPLGSRGGRQKRKRCIRIYHSSSAYLYRPKHADRRIRRVRAAGGPDSLRSAHRRTTLRGRDNNAIRHRKVEEDTEEAAEFCIARARHWKEIIERCTPQKF
jgi:hypothetical protein